MLRRLIASNDPLTLMHKFLFVLLTCAALAPAQTTQKIAGGPFVVNATSRSATVVWIVQSDEAVLQVAATAAAPAAARSSPSFRVEKTTYTGLQPNTKYEYRVGGQDAGKGSFKTPPAAAPPNPIASSCTATIARATMSTGG